MQIDHGGVMTLAPRRLDDFIAHRLKWRQNEMTLERLVQANVDRKLRALGRTLKVTSKHSSRPYARTELAPRCLRVPVHVSSFER